jgi:flagellar assembly protein FliH
MKEQVTDYVFKSLFKEATKEGVSEFNFHEFTDRELYDIPEKQNTLRIERKAALESSFSIAPVVREHRGINRQEEEEREKTIEDEICKRLKKIKDEAYLKGHQEGIEDGKKEVYEQMRLECEQKIERFSGMLNQVIATQSDLVAQEKVAIYRTIRSLTKWVILKELKDDGEYIERLLAKLIEELQVNSNLLIQVDPKSFEQMPEVLGHLEKSLGKLEQVRVELDYDIAGPGIIIDSDNGIINGTLQEQFNSLDNLFSKVGIEGESSEHENLFQRLSINEENYDNDTEAAHVKTSEPVNTEDSVEDTTKAHTDVETEHEKEADSNSDIDKDDSE